MSKLITHLLLIVVVCGALGGCANGAPAVDEAQATLCQRLAELQRSVRQMADVSAETTVSELKALQAQLDGVVRAMRTANQVLRQTRIDELVAAYDNLVTTIDGLGSQERIGEARSQIQAAVAQVQTAFDQANAALNCNQ